MSEIAVALFQKLLAVFHDEDGGAGDVAALHLQRDEAVEEGFEVGLFQRVRGGRRSRWLGLRFGSSSRRSSFCGNRHLRTQRQALEAKCRARELR